MSSPSGCDFPLTRRTFFGAAAWTSQPQPTQPSASTAAPSMTPRTLQHSTSMPAHRGSESGPPGGMAPASPSLAARPNNLRSLDLKSIPRDDGPPSETQLRRQKFQHFEKLCSEVAEGLFVSGDYVAKSKELLRQHGVTHVINCVGFLCQEYFRGEINYKTLFLQGKKGRQPPSRTPLPCSSRGHAQPSSPTGTPVAGCRFRHPWHPSTPPHLQPAPLLTAAAAC